MPLEDSALVPKYHKISKLLLENITTGTWRLGDEIPSEQELCAKYEVSRGTVRRAIDSLVSQGLLVKVQGKSTYVSKPKIPIFSKGFRSDIRRTGQSANTRIFHFEIRSCEESVGRLLRLPKGSSVYELRRVIDAEGDPIILEMAYIPCRYGDRLNVNDLVHTSLLDLIPQSCGIILKKAIESYEPASLSDEEATLLNVNPGAIAILDQAITYDIADTPIFLSKALIRGDRARVATEITFHI